MRHGWRLENLWMKGNRTSQFMLRPGEGRFFFCLEKELRTVPASAATILLKAVSKTLETNQVLHKWYPAKYTSDKCDLCKQQCETVAHFALACPVLSDATTAAHDKVRKRLAIRWKSGGVRRWRAGNSAKRPKWGMHSRSCEAGPREICERKYGRPG